MKNWMQGKSAVILAGMILGSAPLSAKTYVYLQNNTTAGQTLSTVESGTSLSASYWDDISTYIAAGKRGQVLWFGRDAGITNGKFFYFTTTASGGGRTTYLRQALRGDWVGSHLWQSASDSTTAQPWYDDRSWHDLYGYTGNRLKQLSYHAYFTGGDDDIEYVQTERDTVLTGQSDANTFNVLAWNIYMRPTTLFANGQMIRAGLIPTVLAPYDAIIFSEAFDDDVRAELLSRLAPVFPYRTSIVGADRDIHQDGGVIIVSRWPIELQVQKTFGSTCAGDDCLGDKGIMYAKINKLGRRYHVFGTHTQAWPTTEGQNTRKLQFQILRNFIDSRAIPATEPVLIGGDLNVNRLKFAQEYSDMLTILSAAQPTRTGHPYSFDPTTNKLGSGEQEYLDYVLYSTRHLRPMTSTNEVLFLKTPRPWKEFAWEGDYYDLSDHYAMYGRFSY